MPRKTKIGTEVAHVTRDSDITFKVKRSTVNLQGRGYIVAASRTACLNQISVGVKVFERVLYRTTLTSQFLNAVLDVVRS